MQQPLLDGTTEKLTSPWHPAGHPTEHADEAHAAPAGGPHLVGGGTGGGSTASLTAAFGGLLEGAGPHDKKTRSVAEVPLPKPRPDTKDGKDGKDAKAKEEEKPKQVPGVFPGVTDRTGTYGALADGKRSSTQGVVLHRTESTTAAGTLAGYQDRINSGSHIGAQYLIDEKGATSLITPQDSRVYHAKGFNDAAVGVEVVGPAKKFDRSGNKDKGTIRDQVTAMNLSPEFKARLLGYDDKQLGNVAKWNGDQIYEDISGAQKRSVWNLTSNLATQYGLDMGSTSKAGKDESGSNNYSLSTLPDFSAHEHINPKALGEGEPMIEFMRARKQYPDLVAKAEKKLQQMQAAGARPEELEKYAAMVKREQDTLKALAVDGTQTELDAVKAEKDAKKPGAATTRENQRTDFYDHFYDRMGALKGALK